jgi:hypothetical protein
MGARLDEMQMENSMLMELITRQRLMEQLTRYSVPVPRAPVVPQMQIYDASNPLVPHSY